MGKFKIGDKVQIGGASKDRGWFGKWNGTGVVVDVPEGAMEVLKIKRSDNKTGLKVYGKIKGESGKVYNFAYIRRENFRGWICECESFFFNMFKKNRNCKHLHYIRNAYGRYGQDVPKS
jgi:hypothetical protein